MIGRHNVIPVILDKAATYIAHLNFLSEEAFIRCGSAQEYHLRTHKAELSSEKFLTGIDLDRLRSSVLRGTAFTDVTDMIILITEAI